MSHALIIGGSGMLKGTSIWLASKYDYVTVIGRSKKKMDSLINQCNNIKPLYLDYHDTNNLKLEIEEQIRKLGHIDLIVAWVLLQHLMPFSQLLIRFLNSKIIGV